MKPLQIEAVHLVARDKLTNAEIAARVGISTRTLLSWKSNPDFAAAVTEWRNAWRERVMTDGIADQQRRLFRLNDRWRRMQAVIEQRAQDPSMTAPGCNTGLMVRTYKSIGSGLTAEKVEEYEVDTGLLHELRAHEEQAAIELGQWKREEAHARQVIIVVPQMQAPSVARVIDVPPEQAPLQIPGVVIDLAPQR